MKEDESQEITTKDVEFDLDGVTDDHVRNMTTEELIPTLIGGFLKRPEKETQRNPIWVIMR